MSMEVTTRNLSARATRARLMKPPGGRESSELEVISSPLFRSKKARRRVEAQRAEADFRLQSSIDYAIQTAKASNALLAALRERALTVAIAKVILQEEIREPPKLAAIFTAVCQRYGITRIDLISHRRTLNLIIPRQVAMYLARHHTFRSLPEIGRTMGGRDHTTVICGCRRTAERLAAGDERLANDIAALRATLGLE